MRNPLAFPIRLKILITLLLVVTSVVSLITFTMANLLHDDKRTYVTELTTIVSLSVAEECESILRSYSDYLGTYARIMSDKELTSRKKADLLQGFFHDFRNLVAVSIYEDGVNISTVYDAEVLSSVSLDQKVIDDQRRMYPIDFAALGDGRVVIENTTQSESLPVLTLSRNVLAADSLRVLTVSAVIQMDDLIEISERSQTYDVYLVDTNGFVLTNAARSKLSPPRKASLPPVTHNLNDRSLSVTTEFERGTNAVIGGFARVQTGEVIAVAETPRSSIYLASRQLLKRLVFVSLGLLIVAAIVSQIGARAITKPVERLLQATRRIGRGDFDVRVDVTSRDEMGSLAQSFNTMASELENRDDALSEAQAQLIQSEKMAAFGQLGAGIAHEVKNPLAGILGCAQLSLRKVEQGTPLQRNLQLIEKESKRCKMIVESLLRFARQEKPVLNVIDLNDVVRDAAQIVGHQMSLENIKLELELGELSRIQGNANQLQQVLMNLMINAQQAMPDSGGHIRVRTRMCETNEVEVTVTDDGPGMAPDIRAKIFEPFFTTKPGGKGTGLGLSVSFGIIRDHQGHIDVESEVGKGTTFTICVPAESSRPELPGHRTAAA